VVTAPNTIAAVTSQGAVPPLVSAPTAPQTPSATPVNTGQVVHGRPSASHHQGAIPPHIAALSLPPEATNYSNPAAYGRPASFDQQGALPPHATVPLQGQQNPTASSIDSGYPRYRSQIQEAPSDNATASPSPLAFPPYGFPFQHGSIHPVPGESSMPYYGYLPVYFPSGPFGPMIFPSPMGYGSTGYGSNGANPFGVGNPAPVPSPSEFPSGDHGPPLSNVPVSTSSPPRIEPAKPDIDTQAATSPDCMNLGNLTASRWAPPAPETPFTASPPVLSSPVTGPARSTATIPTSTASALTPSTRTLSASLDRSGQSSFRGASRGRNRTPRPPRQLPTGGQGRNWQEFAQAVGTNEEQLFRACQQEDEQRRADIRSGRIQPAPGYEFHIVHT